MTGPTVTQRAMSVVKQDVAPSSADHVFRLIVCGLLLALGGYIFVTHPHDKAWERGDLIIALAPIGAGLLIAFTRTVLSAAALVLPAKNGSPPPPAEAA